MRKAKIAAMIFGGVSTCICGGILGVYSGSATVGTVAPKNDVENIYDVQSEKLANFAAVTSIRTTAITTTSTTTTTSSVDSEFTTTDDETPSVILSVAVPPATSASTTVVLAETTTTTEAGSVEDFNDNNNDESPVYSASVGGLTISGPFIASDEPEITTEAAETIPEETTATTVADEDSDEEFVFEPATEYFPPAVEYIAPARETTTATEATTTETTTSETTSTTEAYTEVTTTTATAYVITTAEYTVTTAEATTADTTESTTTEIAETAETTETTVSEIAETETTTAETTTVSSSLTAFVIAPETTTATTVSAGSTSLPITDEEYIVLCNAVANEAGSNWIDVYEKGKVVEVIMNRVNSPLYPDTIMGVLTQPYQFTGAENYVYLGTYSGYVTDLVKEAVDLYFAEPDSFGHNYFGFWGDGYANHFY